MSSQTTHSTHSTIPTGTSLNTAFRIGIVLNLAYVIFQVVYGLHINSLAVLSDAGHNFLDVAGLALSVLALYLTKSQENKQFTFGYKKASVLISLFNAIVLIVSIVFIAYESILRFKNPERVEGFSISIVAFFGIIINGFSAAFFFKHKEADINVKSAYLHLLSDALVSIGLLIAGIVLHFKPSWYWIDPTMSLVICAIIVFSTLNLLKESLRMAIDAVPEGLDVAHIINQMNAIDGVVDFHHVHIWSISTTENAITAHVLVQENLSKEAITQLKYTLRDKLLELGIAHSTLEIDFVKDADEI
jgi:cobalt-zinc-cadmium efflux system protein